MEFALAMVKTLEGSVSTTQLANDLADLGQNLYHPPTVKGWVGGRHWINSATIVGRHNLASDLLRGKGPYGDKLKPWVVAQRHGCSTAESAQRFLSDLLLQGVPETLAKTAPARLGEDSGAEMRRFTHTVVTLAEFQLA